MNESTQRQAMSTQNLEKDEREYSKTSNEYPKVPQNHPPMKNRILLDSFSLKSQKSFYLV
jgi:hypothetical protein